MPTRFPVCRRLVNDIVLGEESDEFGGSYLGHFELYRQSMLEAGANVRPIQTFLEELSNGKAITDALVAAGAPEEARRFVQTTFSIIDQGDAHVVAAAFTFGREDVIPDMFRLLVWDLSRRFPGQLGTFLFYLERHVDVDGENLGPMALRTISELCADDKLWWDEAAQAAEQALNARLAFWTATHNRITLTRNNVAAIETI